MYLQLFIWSILPLPQEHSLKSEDNQSGKLRPSHDFHCSVMPAGTYAYLGIPNP